MGAHTHSHPTPRAVVQPFPPKRWQTAREKAKELLACFEERLADGRAYLHGDTLSAADVSLAALNYMWVLNTPTLKALFALGQDHGAFSQAPEHPAITSLSTEFSEQFPRVRQLCVKMYETERHTCVGMAAL